jgi:hypothetical protein
MVRILREKLLESSDSATTSSRRVSAIKVHLSLIAGDSGIMVEYWLGASARQSGFAEEEERAKIHSHFAQPDYLDPDV